jgi:hypothetical protein
MSDLFKRSSQNMSLSHGEALQQAQLDMLNRAKNDWRCSPTSMGLRSWALENRRNETRHVKVS